MIQRAIAMRIWVVGLCGVAIVLGGQARIAAAEAFEIEVRIILASNADKGTDPRLVDLKKDLQTLNYMSFEQLDTVGLSLDKGKTGKVPLPGDRVLELTPVAFEKGKVNLQVKILEKGASILTTKLRVANHGTVLLGGPPHNLGFLVLALTVNF
ncbi:MAG: hypothetical protein R3231_02810 [bacterium]|nr:hypothetical protein [bacterium]